MASSSGTSQEQRRWLVVGIALHHVLTPCLRDKIKTEITPFYQHVVRSFGLDKQTSKSYKKTIPPSTINLSYESINNNRAVRSRSHYDYRVKDEVSLAKLFMKPFMAHFNAFDDSFDASAALAVLCGSPWKPFTSVKRWAEDVRSKVRNEWAHCDFTAWTEVQYNTCFDLMEALVTNLRFNTVDETRILDELKLWKGYGLEICLGKPLDDTLLQIIRMEVQQLSESMDDYQEEQVKKIRLTFDDFKFELDRAIVKIQEKQASLETTCEELERKHEMIREQMSTKDMEQKMYWEATQEVQSRCKELEVKSSVMQRDLDFWAAKVNISHSEDFNLILFDAPEQNRWFTGREKEIENLEKCLPLNKCNGLKISAICGLGGCGKSTLATHFAWRHKLEYEGGVFWISMEDERKFESSVSDLALRLGIEANSFDLTLSKFLTWISKREKPWLLVIDDIDQLNLSEQMHMVLSGRWKRQASGHVLLTTRREPKELCRLVDLEPSCCVEAFAFSEEEAKRFLVTRCGAATTGKEVALDELVRELGCLPLALEQAGAHIKALQCSISNYLEEYKIQRLTLLSHNPRAKPLWEYESKNRLAVHTTWLINFEYVRKSPQGELATRFLHAAAFFAPNEIQEKLINCELFSSDHLSHQNYNFALLRNEIVEILTKFSLFQRKSCSSLGLHRLVQEVIRNRMTIEETASSLLKAVQLLHQSFRRSPSPDQILVDITASDQKQPSASLTNPSLFYSWSKLTRHASELQQHLKALLGQQNIGREVKETVLTRETSRVIYENAVQLSVRGHQADAKEAERFAYQIFDSCTSAGVPLSTEDLTKLFPHTLPLSQIFQKTVLYSSQPPIEHVKFASDGSPSSAVVDAIRLQGNALFKKERFKEAAETYTKALELSVEGKHSDPRLLNNRATAYLKLGNYTQCLQDSEEYIKILPTCWKGYTRKALALNGLGLRVSALCSAAIAYCHNATCCRRYEAFRNEFKDLDGKWEVVDSSETLRRSLQSNKRESSGKKVLLLANAQYDISGINEIANTTLAALDNRPDVIIKCEMPIVRKTCFFQSIVFLAKQGIVVEAEGNAEFQKCSFQNCTSESPVISILGSATLFECTVRDSKGSGIGVQGSNSSATLLKSRICGIGRMDRPYSYGIRVFNKGRLLVHECHIYGNVRGIWIDEGPQTGVPAKEAIITDSEIYDNKYEGIVVGGVPRFSHVPVVIMRKNKIYHNGTFGVRATLNITNILFESNMVFENLWWGVCVHNNSGGVYKDNEICTNKMGGIMVGKQSPGKPPCVVVDNFIHDNYGPAFYEGLRYPERDSFPEECKKIFTNQLKMAQKEKTMLWNVSLPNEVLGDFNSNQCIQNDQGQKSFKAVTLKTHCVFCFRHDIDLKLCKRCMTATYCGKECQELHWKRHKYTCKATGQRNAVEVPFPEAPYCFVTRGHPGLQPSGPDYSPPPPKDGSRFIVKIQTFEAGVYGDIIDMRGFVTDEQDPNKARILLYDRSHYVSFLIYGNPQLFHLIMECGMMGKSMSLTKKLYCWAAYKDVKTLRIFTHEFPEVQKW